MKEKKGTQGVGKRKQGNVWEDRKNKRCLRLEKL